MNTEQARRYLCREHGECSISSCREPIIGWVDRLWGPKLCEQHLSEVEASGEPTYRPQKWAEDVAAIDAAQ